LPMSPRNCQTSVAMLRIGDVNLLP
jgi:hypothetical protein